MRLTLLVSCALTLIACTSDGLGSSNDLGDHRGRGSLRPPRATISVTPRRLQPVDRRRQLQRACVRAAGLLGLREHVFLGMLRARGHAAGMPRAALHSAGVQHGHHTNRLPSQPRLRRALHPSTVRLRWHRLLPDGLRELHDVRTRSECVPPGPAAPGELRARAHLRRKTATFASVRRPGLRDRLRAIGGLRRLIAQRAASSRS